MKKNFSIFVAEKARTRISKNDRPNGFATAKLLVQEFPNQAENTVHLFTYMSKMCLENEPESL